MPCSRIRRPRWRPGRRGHAQCQRVGVAAARIRPRRAASAQPLSGSAAGGLIERWPRCTAVDAEPHPGRARQRRGDRPAGARVLPRRRGCDPDPAADLRHVRGLRARSRTRRASRCRWPTDFTLDVEAVLGGLDAGGEAGFRLHAEQSRPGRRSGSARVERLAAGAARVARCWWSTRPTSSSPMHRARPA